MSHGFEIGFTESAAPGTRVTNGAVLVRDYRRPRRVLVRAGHSCLAKAKPARRTRCR